MATYTVGPSGSGADYIVDGDEDQTQINSALAAAKAVPGSTVYLKGPFDYDVDSTQVQIGNNTTLTGDSTACLKLHDDCDWAHQIHLIKQSDSIAQNITIHGFEIDCNRDNQNFSEGDGYHNAIGLRGNSNNPGNNIIIHDMTIHDSLGDGARLQFINNITIYDNNIGHMGHEDVFLIQCSGADIYENTFTQRCNSSVRLDNCQNVNIHHNTCNSSNINGNGHIQIGNEPASYGLTKLTQNINIYNNILNDSPGSGILLMDAWGTAGTTAQTVKIYNNTIKGCGWKGNYVKYNAGISCWKWGNGVTIFNNIIDANYNAGLLIRESLASGCNMSVYDNNIINTKNTLSTDSSKRYSVTGYGFLNTMPSKMAIYAENNYLSGNVGGTYYQVTPISTADSLIVLDEEDEDVTVTPTTRYIPPIRITQEDLVDYYDITEPKMGYINGVPFYWQQKSGSAGRSVGQNKPPGVDGENFTVMGFKGGSLTLDCLAFSIADLKKVIAAFYDESRGRSIIELGGPYGETRYSGITIDHDSRLRLTDDVPEDAHPYSILFQTDKPYEESRYQKIRGKYVTGSMQWSADDTYAGNLLKNPSFEAWSSSTDLTLETESSPYDNDWRCVRWSRELSQYCAVASTGTNTRIIKSSGGEWTVPSGLSSVVNRDNNWHGLAWGSSIGIVDDVLQPGRWVAVATGGTSGYYCITSDDTDAWTARATPANNAWNSVCYIRDDTNEVYRYVAVASTGTYRVMYTDNGAASWTNVASADDTAAWISVCYAESIDTLVAVSYDGKIMYSTTKGATWNLASSVPSPAQKYTDVVWAEQLGLFVACSEDGTQQIVTSEDGDEWTLQDTPICGSVTVPGTGSDVSTTTYQTPSGWVYSTLSTSYSTTALKDSNSATDPDEGILSIEALTNSHKWRLDRVFCQLRSGGTCCNAWIKITATAASVNSGNPVTLAEWNTNSTSYIPESQDIVFEAANNEAITITVSMKTDNASIKSIVTGFGYDLTEFDGTGGSTIEYTYNEWQGLTWSPEDTAIVCVAKSGTGNRAMMSTTADNWILVDTPEDNNWLSVCYSGLLNKFVSVGSVGTAGTGIMSADDYGGATSLSNWTVEGDGVSRSDLIAHSGLYSLQITADGVLTDVGLTKQYALFDPGVLYVFSAWGRVDGLTTGKFAVDIYSGNSIIAQLVFDSDCEYTQLQSTIKFDTAPTDAYFRIHGIETPNNGAVFNCDDVLLERAADFEVGTTGSDITTTGTVDVIPDVEIRSIMSSSSAGVTRGGTSTYADAYLHSCLYTYFYEDFTITLPKLQYGSYYRIDQIKCLMYTANVSGATGYAKVTITAASINGGAETTLATWSTTTKTPSSEAKIQNLETYSVTDEEVIIKIYLRTSKNTAKVYVDDITITYTEMIPTVTTSAISIYNTSDTLTMMDCCNELKPGYSIALNANGTGWFKYSENFADGQYLFVVTDYLDITYNNDEKNLLFESTGYITYKFDTKYPITGVPYIVLNVIQGAPKIYIAKDISGSPDTFYELDGNSTTDIENIQAYRLLNSGTNVILNGLTAFHLKIASGGTNKLQINSIFMYAEIVTIDAERPKIFKGQSNTFGALVDSTASAIITLKYRDADILV